MMVTGWGAFWLGIASVIVACVIGETLQTCIKARYLTKICKQCMRDSKTINDLANKLMGEKGSDDGKDGKD